MKVNKYGHILTRRVILSIKLSKNLETYPRVVFALVSIERDIREGRKINMGESNGTSRDKNTKGKKKQTEARF